MLPERHHAELFHNDRLPRWAPLPDNETIFRELITTELRAGRLTPLRRARIVRYALQIGLSAVQAGRLIAQCHDEALARPHESTDGFALRVVHPPVARLAMKPRVAIITGILLLIVWMLRW